MRRWHGAALAASAWLAACGGGGGSGDDDDLEINFYYAVGRVEVLQSVSGARPQLDGLDGHSPHCELSSGSLPPGVGLNEDCSLRGAATEPGTYRSTVRLTVSHYKGSLTAELGLEVATPTLEQVPFGSAPPATQSLVVQAPVSRFAVAQVQNWTPDATRTVRYDVTSGAFPPGLSFDAATGTVSGTPTLIGRYAVGIRAVLSTSATSTTTAERTVVLDVGEPALVIRYPETITAFVGEPLSVTPTSSYVPAAGTSTVWTADMLPAGVTLDAATGRIGGAATESGPGVFFVTQTVALPGGASASTRTLVSLRLDGIFVSYLGGYLERPADVSLVVDPSIQYGHAGDRDAFELDTVYMSTGAGSVLVAPPPWLHLDADSGRLVLDPKAPGAAVHDYQVRILVRTLRDGVVYGTRHGVSLSG